MKVQRISIPALFLAMSLFGQSQKKSDDPSAKPLPESIQIGQIDFFGSAGIDVDKVRAALPVHQDEQVALLPAYQGIEEAVQRVTGKPATDVTFVCCDDHGHQIFYIGLAGDSTNSFAFNDPPRGTDALPRQALELYKKWLAASNESVEKGHVQEDESQGYALDEDPALRKTQLAMREYALHHGDLILRVLEESSAPNQRIVAAELLGYATQSNEQLNALARASRDPDDTARNNAVRALLVLAKSSPTIAARIPPQNFIAMLSSGKWTDRNKSAGLLRVLTAGRDPKLLSQLRAQALPALIEMAQWQDMSHAEDSRVLLGRIAGIEEPRLDELAKHNDQTDVILAAVQASAK